MNQVTDRVMCDQDAMETLAGHYKEKSVSEETQAPETKETFMQHVHDEIEKVIHAIESGAHNGVEHLKALKEKVSKHL